MRRGPPSPFAGHMSVALAEAHAAYRRGEVPVGAAIADPNGQLIAATGNRVREYRDPTAHAEILAIRAACKRVSSERLPGYHLYVTLEPCAMCATAISLAQIARLHYAASDPKSGAIEFGPQIFESRQIHHKPEIYVGTGEKEARGLLQDFFARLRKDS